MSAGIQNKAPDMSTVFGGSINTRRVVTDEGIEVTRDGKIALTTTTSDWPHLLNIVTFLCVTYLLSRVIASASEAFTAQMVVRRNQERPLTARIILFIIYLSIIVLIGVVVIKTFDCGHK